MEKKSSKKRTPKESRFQVLEAGGGGALNLRFLWEYSEKIYNL